MKFTALLFAAAATTALFACKSSNAEATSDSEAAAESVEEAAAPEAQGAVVVLESDEVNVESYGGKPVFIDFNATWCGPCQAYGPTFHAVAEKYADKAAFLSVDTDKNPTVAATYVGSFIPQTTAIATNGDVISKVGMLSEAELTAFVDSVLSL